MTKYGTSHCSRAANPLCFTLPVSQRKTKMNRSQMIFNKPPSKQIRSVQKPGTVLAFYVSFGLFCCVWSTQADPETLDSIASFKTYLASPPCITRMVYKNHLGCNAGMQETYVLACCSTNFYLRSFTGADKLDVPISPSNRMHTALFAGQYGDLSWQINGFGVWKAISPDRTNPDPYRAFSGAMRNIMYGVINCGAQQILPGTFIWKGNEFTAQANPALRAVNGSETIGGRIATANGRVTRMEIVRASGNQSQTTATFSYDYYPSADVPSWFPTVITVSVQGKCLFKFSVEKLAFGNPDDQVDTFTPDKYILGDVALVTLVSNNQVIISPNNVDPRVVAITQAAMPSPISGKSNWRHRASLVTVIIVSLVPMIWFAVPRIWKSRRI